VTWTVRRGDAHIAPTWRVFSSRSPGANAGMTPQGEIQVLPLRGVALAVIQATTGLLPHYVHVRTGDDAPFKSPGRSIATKIRCTLSLRQRLSTARRAP
jgi:hypothetical protein